MTVDWEAVAEAYRLVVGGTAERVDGKGWKVYRAGTIIRIDIEQSH